MSGGEKQRDPLLFPYLGQGARIRHTTLQPGTVSFPGAAAENKRPVNMRPETVEDWIAHLDSMVKTRPAAGLLESKTRAAKKKTVPAMHQYDVSPNYPKIAAGYLAVFPERCLVFFNGELDFRRSSPIPLYGGLNRIKRN